MTDSKEIGGKISIPPPSYTFLESKGREQFLSEIGNCTPQEREIFHTLCKTWQPEIPYKRFISQVSGSIKNPDHELERLMEKLSQKNCGIILKNYENNEAVNDRIILTSPGECRYYFYRLLNEFEAFNADINADLPFESVFQEKGLTFPAACFEILESEDFSRIFDEKTGSDRNIFRVAVSSADAVYIPSGWGTRFISQCLERIRDYLTNTNLAAEVAKQMDSPLSDVRKNSEGKDPLFWLALSKAIVDIQANPVLVKRLPVDKRFFRTGSVLSRFIDRYIADLKKKKIETLERDQDMEVIVLRMEEEKSLYLSSERFNILIGAVKDKYGDKFSDFRREFSQKFVEYKEKVKLPVIIPLSGGYIHRNNFFDFFQRRLTAVRDILAEEYVKIMENLLRTNNRERKLLFFSRENFEIDIQERLRIVDPLLAEVFDKPRILAEAVIHTLREKRLVRDLNEIKLELEKYFKPDTMVYRTLSLIFGFTVIDFFLRAFAHLPFWRQIWIRITGRYKAYQRHYMGMSTKMVAGPPRTKPLKKDTPVKQQAQSKAEAREPVPGGRRIKFERIPRKKRTRETSAKPYSQKDRESAWNEFSKSIKPKK